MLVLVLVQVPSGAATAVLFRGILALSALVLLLLVIALTIAKKHHTSIACVWH